jgi:hypothetical protein
MAAAVVVQVVEHSSSVHSQSQHLWHHSSSSSVLQDQPIAFQTYRLPLEVQKVQNP